MLYCIGKEEPHPLVQVDVFLLHSGFEMTWVVGARATIPRSRSVRDRQKDDGNGYAVPQLNLQTIEKVIGLEETMVIFIKLMMLIEIEDWKELNGISNQCFVNILFDFVSNDLVNAI